MCVASGDIVLFIHMYCMVNRRRIRNLNSFDLLPTSWLPQSVRLVSLLQVRSWFSL